MAVEHMMGYSSDHSFATKMQASAVIEATTAGIQSVEEVIELLQQNQLQQQQQQQQHRQNCRELSPSSSSNPGTANIMAVTDEAVNNFKKVISLLDRSQRTGHARFRRGPVTPVTEQNEKPELQPQTEQQKQQVQQPVVGLSVKPIKSQPTNEQGSAFRVYQPTPVHRLPPLPNNHSQQQKAPLLVTKSGLNDAPISIPPFSVAKNGFLERKEVSSTINFSYSRSISATTSFMSSLTRETDSNQRSVSSGFQFTHPSTGTPSLSSPSLKRKSYSMDDAALKGGRCHCPKKKKSRSKRVITVPAISSKMADIPPDDYSWRKYGQKPIKGSPHPRGYYKCSGVKGCPARKHVERARDNPMMLVVTYEGEHNHTHSSNDAPVALVLETSS